MNISLKLKAPLSGDNLSIPLTITCTDTGEPAQSMENTFEISVVETVVAPKDVQLTDMNGSVDISVNENTADVVVGTLAIVNALTNDVIQSVRIKLCIFP